MPQRVHPPLCGSVESGLQVEGGRLLLFVVDGGGQRGWRFGMRLVHLLLHERLAEEALPKKGSEHLHPPRSIDYALWCMMIKVTLIRAPTPAAINQLSRGRGGREDWLSTWRLAARIYDFIYPASSGANERGEFFCLSPSWSSSPPLLCCWYYGGGFYDRKLWSQTLLKGQLNCVRNHIFTFFGLWWMEETHRREGGRTWPAKNGHIHPRHLHRRSSLYCKVIFNKGSSSFKRDQVFWGKIDHHNILFEFSTTPYS